jgi:hypothetical protein
MTQANGLTASVSTSADGGRVTPSTVVRVPPHIVFRAFASETLILNLETGLYHSLNSTGGRMLELLGECGQVQTVVDRLAADYDRRPELLSQELCEYCAELAGYGLLEITASA